MFFKGLLLTLFLCGCHPTKVGQLRREVSGEKYLRTAIATRHRIEVQYVPPSMAALAATHWDDSVSLSENRIQLLNGSKLDSEGLTFFLRLEPIAADSSNGFAKDVVFGNISGMTSIPQVQQEYRTGFQEKIWLEIRGEKLPLSSFQMENNFGMSRGRTFVLLFNAKTIKGGTRNIPLTLVLDDLVPGLSRKKLEWTLPIGKHDEKI